MIFYFDRDLEQAMSTNKNENFIYLQGNQGSEQLLTSKMVFSERKVNLDNAYKMALELINQNSTDEWNQRALAWCLIDLIKRDVKENKIINLETYKAKLENIVLDDEILNKQKEFVLGLLNPNQKEMKEKIAQAKILSKQGNHRDAANIYFKLLKEHNDN